MNSETLTLRTEADSDPDVSVVNCNDEPDHEDCKKKPPVVAIVIIVVIVVLVIAIGVTIALIVVREKNNKKKQDREKTYKAAQDTQRAETERDNAIVTNTNERRQQ